VDSSHFEFPIIGRRRTLSIVSASDSLYSKMSVGILHVGQSSAEIQVISGFFQVDSRHFEFPGIARRRTMSAVSALGSLYSKM